MEINLKETFKTLDGTEVPEVPNNPDGKKMDLKGVCAAALLNTTDQDKNVSGAEKAKRYLLAQEIHNAKDVLEIESENITLLKKLIGNMYTPLIVGQAYEMLEGKTKKKDKK